MDRKQLTVRDKLRHDLRSLRDGIVGLVLLAALPAFVVLGLVAYARHEHARERRTLVQTIVTDVREGASGEGYRIDERGSAYEPGRIHPPYRIIGATREGVAWRYRLELGDGSEIEIRIRPESGGGWSVTIHDLPPTDADVRAPGEHAPGPASFLPKRLTHGGFSG